MQEDPSSVFNQPEFKASLAKYEQMMQDGIRVYFEAEELTLIAEYILCQYRRPYLFGRSHRLCIKHTSGKPGCTNLQMPLLIQPQENTRSPAIIILLTRPERLRSQTIVY